MLGIILNLILISLGVLAFASGISFYFNEREMKYISYYTMFFGITTFLICDGYAVMGFMTNLKAAAIVRQIGLYGIDLYLLLQIAFLTKEIKLKARTRYLIIGFYALFVMHDLIIFGDISSVKMVRYDYHTAYEHVGVYPLVFHYTYIISMIVGLMITGIKWFNSLTARRDKRFVVELILADWSILLFALPEYFAKQFTQKYPAFPYCIAFVFVYFFFWSIVKRHVIFTPTAKNVSEQVFYSIDIPILIFDMDGIAKLFNPFAKKMFNVEDGHEAKLRDLFELSDVETLRLLARSKNGWSGNIKTKIKSDGSDCTLNCKIQLDNVEEPFCIIVTVMTQLLEENN